MRVAEDCLSAGSGAIDFSGLASALLGQARVFLPQWFPNGRFQGKEFKVGSLHGEAGSSLKIDVETGVWKDFGGNDKGGGDLISLYAAKEGIKQGEAAKLLAPEVGFNLSPNGAPKRSLNGNGTKPEPEPSSICKPAAGTAAPDMTHRRFGVPSCTYLYKDTDGSTFFYIARYDPSGQKKQFIPFCWDSGKKRWVNEGYPAPRPLYGLDLLAARPEAPVLLVEGEKACEAARAIVGDAYIATTWPNGASGWRQVDWSPLKDRKVLLWPDADRHEEEA